MKKTPVFKGAATALITPFNENGIDYNSLGKLIEWQISEGINAIAVASTTGEGSTLSDKEHRELIAFTVERVDHRVPVIAGTGSNDTNYAKKLTSFACSEGVDAVLVVTPYYNKTTQKGLVKMYETIADTSTKPVILYNVPSRTGVNIEPATYLELSKHPNINGFKEANGNISKIVEAAAVAGDELNMYSGNDDQIVPIMAMGGIGVISVISNVMPAKTALLCKKFFEGDLKESARLQCEMLPLINALFCVVNPIPVKAAMAAMGFCENYVRLPLTTLEPQYEDMLRKHMAENGLI